MTRHGYVHPALRAVVDTITPAPLDPTGGPLFPEQPLNLLLTYHGVVVRLAELADRADFRTVQDLPPLEAEDVAAALMEYPRAFIDALADLDTTRDVVINLLAHRKSSREDQHTLIGFAFVAALGDYLRPIIWKAVESQRETNRRNRAIEQDNAHAEERAAVRQGALS